MASEYSVGVNFMEQLKQVLHLRLLKVILTPLALCLMAPCCEPNPHLMDIYMVTKSEGNNGGKVIDHDQELLSCSGDKPEFESEKSRKVIN